MPTKSSNSFIIIDFRSQKKNSSNEFLHKTWFNKALFAYFENHFRKKRTFEKKRMEEHICQQKMMAWGIFFFIGGIISHFYCKPYFIIFSAILYSNTSYLQLYLTNFQLNVTNINVNRNSIYQTF